MMAKVSALGLGKLLHRSKEAVRAEVASCLDSASGKVRVHLVSLQGSGTCAKGLDFRVSALEIRVQG